MKPIEIQYQIKTKVRVSRLVIGLLSLALLLTVQFYVVGGVTGDATLTRWSSGREVFEAHSSPDLNYKAIMAVLLMLGLALVTLGVECIIDKTGSGHSPVVTRKRGQNKKDDRYGIYRRKEHHDRQPSVKQLSVHSS